MPKALFTLPGQESPISLECKATSQGYTFVLGAEQQDAVIEPNGPNAGTLFWQEEVWPFYFYQEATTLHLWMGGRIYRLEGVDLSPKRGTAQGVAAAGGEVKAPMPGTILQVKVKAGDTVEANQPVIIMESMKMEMTLAAPKAGWVAHIAGLEGQLVEMGTVLLKIEEQEP